MRKITQCLKEYSKTSLLVLSLLVSSLSSLLSFLPANAATAYDEVIQTISEPIISSPYGTPCEVNLATSWFTILSDYATVNGGTAQTMVDHINNNETGWAVTVQTSYYDTAYKELHIYQWNDSTPLEFSTIDGHPALYSFSSFNEAEIACNDANPEGYIYRAPSSWSGQPIAQGQFEGGEYGGNMHQQNPWFINQPINYPSGYEGGIPPDTGTPVSNKLRPIIGYVVNDKNLKTLYKNDIPTIGAVENFKIRYEIEQKQEDDTYLVLEDLTKIAEKNQLVQEWDLPEHGQYKIKVSFEHPGVPYIGFPEEIELLTSSYPITIDGGQSNSENVTCDEQGECVEAALYEDCSAHNISITTWSGGPEFSIPSTESIGCSITNFGKWLINSITWLFTPSANVMKDVFGDSSENFKDGTGLSSVITAPIESFESMLTAGCTPISLPLPFVGESLSLPCMTDFYTNHLGAFYTMYQTVVSGAIAYYVLVNIFAMVKGFKDPENDKIEVAKL